MKSQIRPGLSTTPSRTSRLQAGLTRDQLAEATSLPLYWLGHWERGRAIPTETELQKLVEICKSHKRGFDFLHPLHSASITCTIVQEKCRKIWDFSNFFVKKSRGVFHVVRVLFNCIQKNSSSAGWQPNGIRMFEFGQIFGRDWRRRILRRIISSVLKIAPLNEILPEHNALNTRESLRVEPFACDRI